MSVHLSATKNGEGAKMMLQCWESIERHLKHMSDLQLEICEHLEMFWFLEIMAKIFMKLNLLDWPKKWFSGPLNLNYGQKGFKETVLPTDQQTDIVTFIAAARDIMVDYTPCFRYINQRTIYAHLTDLQSYSMIFFVCNKRWRHISHVLCYRDFWNKWLQILVSCILFSLF